MPFLPPKITTLLLTAGATALSIWLQGCATVSLIPPDPIESQISEKNPRWNNYEKYLAQLLKAIQANWYTILAESRLSPPRGSRADVTFTINSNGEACIVGVSNANCGKLGVMACENAVMYSQPYPKWSESMITDLGKSQTIMISFTYQ